ncbi:MAG TPA: ABC transporter permease, partial [Candidatus Angelobacter sp.]
MLTFIQDVRYGWRMLQKNPGFATVAIITLAVGIGANVAIFSYVDELWLHPLPVPHPDRVVRIFTSNPSSKGEIEQGYSSYPDFEYLRGNAKTLSGVALHEGRGAMLDTGAENKLVTAAVISDNFFDVLQPQPAVGRLFSESEFQSGGGPRIVLSYPFWQRQYNGDLSIAGKTIILDRQHVTVTGVLPRSFRGTEAMLVRDVWIPISTWKQLIGVEQRLTLRGSRDYELFGRLQDSASLSQAQAELAGISTQLASAYPESNTGRKITVIPESHARADVIVKFGLILLGVAALVLLIACSNVASLLIARTEYRRHEIATRIALGATRIRIICQMLTETMMLALVGAAAAIWVGNTLLHALPRLMPQMTFSVGVDAYLSSRGLIVAVLVTVGSMLVFGLVPAVLASRTVLADTFRQRTETARVRSVVRSVLVVGQVALSLVLVVCTGLLTRSLLHALGMDPGFNAHQQMLVIDFVPETGKRDSDVNYVREARRRIEALPGAGPTTVAMRIPFGLSGGGATHKVFVPGSLASTDPQGTTINFDPVADNFFGVLGTRILRGRPIDARDIQTKAHVVVVNQQMASRFWPDDDPINKRVRL